MKFVVESEIDAAVEKLVKKITLGSSAMLDHEAAAKIAASLERFKPPADPEWGVFTWEQRYAGTHGQRFKYTGIRWDDGRIIVSGVAQATQSVDAISVGGRLQCVHHVFRDWAHFLDWLQIGRTHAADFTDPIPLTEDHDEPEFGQL